MILWRNFNMDYRIGDFYEYMLIKKSNRLKFPVGDWNSYIKNGTSKKLKLLKMFYSIWYGSVLFNVQYCGKYI